MADRGEQSAEVMGTAEEDTTDQDPQHAGQPAEAGSSGGDGAGNGAGTGDGGEMVTHQNGGGGGDVVDIVAQSVSRSRLGAFTDAPLLAQPAAVEDIAAQQDSDTNEQKCDTIHCVYSPFDYVPERRFCSRIFFTPLPAGLARKLFVDVSIAAM